MSELLKRPETMVDIYRLLPEGTPVQVIDNKLYMSPAPNLNHFNTVDSIVEKLKEIVKDKKSGKVYFAPVDVFLGNKNAVQPDVFFVRTENTHIIHEDAVYGAPDIIIEVLSKGNLKADLIKKKAVYEEYRVKEYFIVNPVDKEVITYYLEDQKYLEQTRQKGRLKSYLLNAEVRF